MKTTFNFIKGIYSYITFFVIFITICSADSENFGNWMFLLFVAAILGFGFYKLCKTHTEDEINEFLGFNFIKDKFNIDLINEPEAENPFYVED